MALHESFQPPPPESKTPPIGVPDNREVTITHVGPGPDGQPVVLGEFVVSQGLAPRAVGSD